MFVITVYLTISELLFFKLSINNIIIYFGYTRLTEIHISDLVYRFSLSIQRFLPQVFAKISFILDSLFSSLEYEIKSRNNSKKFEKKQVGIINGS